jgi:hypothetical protein
MQRENLLGNKEGNTESKINLLRERTVEQVRDNNSMGSFLREKEEKEDKVIRVITFIGIAGVGISTVVAFYGVAIGSTLLTGLGLASALISGSLASYISVAYRNFKENKSKEQNQKDTNNVQ